jgi:hypothetical protein
MGWDTGTPEGKRNSVPGASMIYPRGKRHAQMHAYKAVVIDVNAWYRAAVPKTLPQDTSPLEATARIFWTSIFTYADAAGHSHQTMPNLEYVTFCFDDGAKLPEMRHIFHAEKRYAPDDRCPRADERKCPKDGKIYKRDEYPIDDELIDEITMTSLPAKWACVWNNNKGKNKLWSVIIECIKHIIHAAQRTHPGAVYIIDENHGDRWVHPVIDADNPNLVENGMAPLWYGEADLKALHWSLYYEGCGLSKVFFITNDWDSVLTSLIHDAAIDILIATPHTRVDEPGSPFLYDASRVAARSPKLEWNGRSDRSFEIIHMDVLLKRYPSMERRYEILMVLFCNGGVDYCDGLSKFGYSERTALSMLDVCNSGKAPKWISFTADPESPGKRRMEFNPAGFVNLMQFCGPRNKSKAWQSASTIAFNKELHDMLFCVTYFAGWDSQACPGGPGVPDYDAVRFVNHDILPTMGTVYNSPRTLAKRHVLVETTATPHLYVWPYPLLYSFPRVQIDAIMALFGGKELFFATANLSLEYTEEEVGDVELDAC